MSVAVCWELGEKWRSNFDIISFLDEENVHHREFHGMTHALFYSMARMPAFQLIVLRDLVSYLHDPTTEGQRQHALYSVDPDI